LVVAVCVACKGSPTKPSEAFPLAPGDYLLGFDALKFPQSCTSQGTPPLAVAVAFVRLENDLSRWHGQASSFSESIGAMVDLQLMSTSTISLAGSVRGTIPSGFGTFTLSGADGTSAASLEGGFASRSTSRCFGGTARGSFRWEVQDEHRIPILERPLAAGTTTCTKVSWLMSPLNSDGGLSLVAPCNDPPASR
jgi:hypothetical protein